MELGQKKLKFENIEQKWVEKSINFYLEGKNRGKNRLYTCKKTIQYGN